MMGSQNYKSSFRGARQREPGIHNHDREYGFRVRRFAPPRNDEV
jgi:hypothetical protein